VEVNKIAQRAITHFDFSFQPPRKHPNDYVPLNGRRASAGARTCEMLFEGFHAARIRYVRERTAQCQIDRRVRGNSNALALAAISKHPRVIECKARFQPVKHRRRIKKERLKKEKKYGTETCEAHDEGSLSLSLSL